MSKKLATTLVLTAASCCGVAVADTGGLISTHLSLNPLMYYGLEEVIGSPKKVIMTGPGQLDRELYLDELGRLVEEIFGTGYQASTIKYYYEGKGLLHTRQEEFYNGTLTKAVVVNRDEHGNPLKLDITSSKGGKQSILYSYEPSASGGTLVGFNQSGKWQYFLYKEGVVLAVYGENKALQRELKSQKTPNGRMVEHIQYGSAKQETVGKEVYDKDGTLIYRWLPGSIAGKVTVSSGGKWHYTYRKRDETGNILRLEDCVSLETHLGPEVNPETIAFMPDQCTVLARYTYEYE